jgi:hypothetical protein
MAIVVELGKWNLVNYFQVLLNGALLESEEFKIKRKISIKTFIFGLLFGLFLCILCIIKLSFIILIN